MFKQIGGFQGMNIKKSSGEAWFDSSENPRKRYFLEKRWNDEGEILGAIMMNPSVADEIQNDPTVDRLIRYAKAKEYVGINVVNIIPFINSKSKEFDRVDIPEVQEIQQTEAIKHMFNHANKIYLSWGKIGHRHLPVLLESEEIRLKFMDQTKKFFATGLSPKDFPYHPLQRNPLLPSLHEDADLKDITEEVRKWVKK